MSLLFYLFICAFLLIYGALNFYIGYRGWQYLFSYIDVLSVKVYWSVLVFFSFSFLLARFGHNVFPKFISVSLSYIGAYWMAAMFYLLQIIIFLDILTLICKIFKFIPWQGYNLQPYVGGTVVIVILLILVGGTINARNPVIRHYDLNINKQAGSLKDLNVVMISDIHLGDIIDKKRLDKIVAKVNELQPDLVLLPGDIIDGSMEPFIDQDMASSFNMIVSSLGVYAVPGNHEHFGENEESMIPAFQAAGITLLRDEYVRIGDSFYIIGREDSAHGYARNLEEKSLENILEGVDKSLPLIMMIHQPVKVDEAIAEGIDLQLSGHTHRGQIFPINFITSRIFEIDWGHLQKGTYNLIVSSGVGTWGPPIRIGNRPEIVEISISFNCY